MIREWLPFDTRYLAAVLIIFVFVNGIRLGYFQGMISHLKGLPLRPYALFLLATVPIVIFTMFWDETILAWVQANNRAGLGNIIRFGGAISRNVEFWMALGLLIFFAALTGRKNLQEVIFGMFLGSVLSSLVGHLLKFVFLRARPYGHFGPFSFLNADGILHNKHVFQSLPSGDVVLVGGAASFLFFAVKNQYLKWLVLLLPITTALYRIAEDKHWPSDTLASIGISLMAGYLLWNHRKPRLAR